MLHIHPVSSIISRWYLLIANFAMYYLQLHLKLTINKYPNLFVIIWCKLIHIISFNLEKNLVCWCGPGGKSEPSNHMKLHWRLNANTCFKVFVQILRFVEIKHNFSLTWLHCTITFNRRRGANKNSMQNQEQSVHLVPLWSYWEE